MALFNIYCVAKYRNKRREDPFVESEKLQKKVALCRKKIRVKNTKGGILCFRGSVRRSICFGRGSGISSMFWTSGVQVEDVKQMNKKVDRSRLTDEKKLAIVRVVQFLRKHRLKN